MFRLLSSECPSVRTLLGLVYILFLFLHLQNEAFSRISVAAGERSQAESGFVQQLPLAQRRSGMFVRRYSSVQAWTVRTQSPGSSTTQTLLSFISETTPGSLRPCRLSLSAQLLCVFFGGFFTPIFKMYFNAFLQICFIAGSSSQKS